MERINLVSIEAVLLDEKTRDYEFGLNVNANFIAEFGTNIETLQANMEKLVDDLFRDRKIDIFDEGMNELDKDLELYIKRCREVVQAFRITKNICLDHKYLLSKMIDKYKDDSFINLVNENKEIDVMQEELGEIGKSIKEYIQGE